LCAGKRVVTANARGRLVVDEHVRGSHPSAVMPSGMRTQVMVQRGLSAVEALAVVERAIQALDDQHGLASIQTAFHGFLQLGIGLERLAQRSKESARVGR
jgi:hypothetical protein